MNDELDKYHELLGLAPGASDQELKEAYRDLAKVWHPDRFSHDPRLQQKAQEKLKEINEAYVGLTSGRIGSRPRRYCTVRHKTKIVPQAEPAQSKGSRLTSIGKRLAEPFK